ncbi:MAG: hypothetical protein EU547_05025 [Promethearchaeota archaeon]|nr:MAG: hypothetical protein EU547_05025 [Candidatus Lokiarchaeota archaeon]
MRYIKLFSDCNANTELLGGKGSNLVKLTKNKFNVPDGFIITTEAYRDFIKNSKYQEKLTELFCTKINPKDVLSHSEKIKEYILKSAIPDIIKREVQEIYREFINKFDENIRFSVRSSATIEDGDKFSFAGQADTYLFRKTLDEILDSIKSCWSSLYSPRALLYFAQIKKENPTLSLDDIYMAIVVQKMVESDISGVLFTANVLNNNIEEMLINSTWGLGEALVSGRINPDTILLNKNTKKVIKKIIGKKEKTTVADYTNSRSKNIKTQPHLQKTCCLTKEHILGLHKIGIKIEEMYDCCPQDIEWAIKNDEIFILQTRPITTLNKD